jgi:hypothetical protein
LVQKGGFADIDEIQLDAVLLYQTLVLLRSPEASRPPSPYQLVWSGRFYEVWQRPLTTTPPVLEHLSLGSQDKAAAIPLCSEIRRLARLAGAEGRLAAVVRPAPTVVNLSQTSHPAAWTTWSPHPEWVYPYAAGTLRATVSLRRGGRYGIWLGGSFRRRVQLWVDGHLVGTARDQLNHPGGYTPFGALTLGAGKHELRLRYEAANLSPGSGGTPFPMGPIIVSRNTADLPITYISPAAATSLCGRSLDWVEALGP